MKAIELTATREALRKRLAELDRIKATCGHCEHLGPAQRCEVFNAVPPEEFRRTEGLCAEWTYDGVPF